MLRAIREIGPRYVVGENVSGLISWNGGLVFDEVQADLEAAGYEVIPFVLPAAGVGAPHRRDRVWFIAYAIGAGRWQASEGWLDSHGQLLQERGREENTNKPIGIDEGQPTPHSENNGCKCGQGSDRWNAEQFHSYECRQNEADGSKPCGRCTQTTADTESISQREQANETEPLTDGGQTRIVPCSIGGGGITTHTTSTGRAEECQPAAQPSEPQRQHSETHIGSGPASWQNFPTQSPVCARNDGFSAESLRQRIREDSMGHLSEKEIDKIISAAATQWRNETIKAAGNAIVPQVFLQICKAIEQFDQKGYTL